MLFTFVFDPAFTGLGILLACALLACALFCADARIDDYSIDLTARWRRRK